ncbi:glycine--tRNA ligase subunit beta [Desulfococcaceae bacterium HSG9]|nr:glycine--tRNA ligase subunit beta [Desulfococcaceae bacterium HSG9]
MDTLLLEIGTEEIPAGYIKPALDALEATLVQKMDKARITHGNARTFATPRKLTVAIENIAPQQTPQTSEITGPPKKVAYDDQGRPTVAAIKFAEKVGIDVDALTVKETAKGSYLCASATDSGGPSIELLAQMLPNVIQALPFPKKMRWGDLALEFPRPIHSILALLGNTVVPFELDGIVSGRFTHGHIFMHPGKIEITDTSDYVNVLSKSYVQIDQRERRNVIDQDVQHIAKELGGQVLPDSELLDTVTNLVEYPFVVAGKFDAKFLELPDEVLITAMREHQKYFAVIDTDNRLMPYFITVSNTKARDMALVAKGNERVLRARLEDARFFYRSDLKIAMDTWVEKLKTVLFQEKLGSVYEKATRVSDMAAFIAEAVAPGSELKTVASRAAILCKADLVSQMVVEFTKLQGIMGRVYADKAGEQDGVAQAIEEHYRPTYSGGALPESQSGAVLSIADKIDSICGFFAVSLIPTGGADPYALRRQGIGIIQIMLNQGFTFSLRSLIDKSLTLLNEKCKEETDVISDKIAVFLQNRMIHLLKEDGFSKDIIAAIISVSSDNIPNVWNKVRALQALKAKPDFTPLAVAFKRVVNIIKKSADSATENISVNTEHFVHESESALFNAFNEVSGKTSDHLKHDRFEDALLKIASLRDPVDAFFDNVMVMDKDLKLRQNRLALLKQIADMFETYADFSKLS